MLDDRCRLGSDDVVIGLDLASAEHQVVVLTAAAGERVRTLSGQPWPERLGFVRSRLARVLRRRDPAGAAEPARGWQQEQKDRVFRATLQAAYAYVRETRTYSGRIVLFLGSRELRRSRDSAHMLKTEIIALHESG